MGYFRRLADPSFKTDDHGNTLFFPWGILGRGYILPDNQTEERIRRFITWYHAIGLTLVFIVGIFLRLWGIAFLILLPIAIIVWLVQARRYIKGLKVTGDKLTFKETLRKMIGK